MSLIVNQWRGNSPSVRHTATVTVNDAVFGALYKVDFDGVASVETRGQDGDTTATIASRLADLLAGVAGVTVDYTAGQSSIEIMGPADGVPMASNITASNPAGSFTERIRPGKLAIDQEFLIALPEDTTGGTFTVSVDFGSGWEETTGQAYNETAENLESDLDALTSASGGDFSVTLEATEPRTYRVKVGGSWAGKSVAIKADTSGLTGLSTAAVSRAQSVGGDAPAVWKIRLHQDSSASTLINVHMNGVAYATQIANVVSQSWWDERLPANTVSFAGGQELHSGGSMTSHAVFSVPADVSISFSGPVSAQVDELQAYQGESHDSFQMFDFTAGTTGTQTVTWNGHTSGGGSMSQIASLLLSLPNINTGEIQGFTFGSVPIYVVQFQNGLGGALQPLIQFGTTDAEYLSEGAGPVNDIHAVTILGATGGTFPLQVSGKAETTDIDFASDDIDDIQAAIDATLSAGETVTVTGTISSFQIEYGGDLAETTIPLIAIDGSGLTGGQDAIISEAVTPVAGINEIQAVNIDPTATGGTYSLVNGQPSIDIPYNDSLPNIEAAYEDLPDIGAGNVFFDGTPRRLLIEYIGALAGRPVDLVKINQDSLIVSGQSALTVSVESLAGSANHWNSPQNWSLDHVPRSGELVVLKGPAGDILHGLVQAAECTFSGTDIVLNQPGDFIDGQVVRLSTSDTLPTAQDSGGAVVLDGSADYYVVAIGVTDSGNQTIKISETDNGEPVEFTNAGTGTHRIGVRLAGIRQFASYAGAIGFPQFIDGAWYPGQRYLQIDLEAPSSNDPNIELGIGDGSGLSRGYFDFGTSHVDARVLKSQGSGDEPAINVLNDNIDESEVVVIGGVFGVGNDPARTPSMRRLIGFAGRSIVGNANFSRIESYNNSVESAISQASSNIVQVRA
ncbi:hypothetical protein [Thalassoglobus polymorphus]|uniref:Uncharacterized protein n=1 Tax=Thalassoglobus polymorphus TaxID=2527994 RepID=A0A517QH74_9PLAN|nr:hypothetical protein [Thalassoglobus polymorphus]QDT30984.1 hypothetical protein Mal48_02130 [Thalassoglobus polymorphus]